MTLEKNSFKQTGKNMLEDLVNLGKAGGEFVKYGIFGVVSPLTISSTSRIIADKVTKKYTLEESRKNGELMVIVPRALGFFFGMFGMAAYSTGELIKVFNNDLKYTSVFISTNVASGLYEWYRNARGRKN